MAPPLLDLSDPKQARIAARLDRKKSPTGALRAS